MYSFETMKAALPECIKHNLKNVLATAWNNDGAETNQMLGICCLPVFSEFCYCGENCSFDDVASVSEYITHTSREWTEALNAYHLGLDGACSVGKRFIYCDPLYNTVKYNTDYNELLRRYKPALETVKRYSEKEETEYYSLLFDIIMRKCVLVRDLQSEYKAGNKAYLKRLADVELPQLVKLYKRLLRVHCKQWLKYNKACGLEVLNIRYGGIIAFIFPH